MLDFINGCVFIASSGGMGPFVVDSAAPGWRTPVQAAAQDGKEYRYRAFSLDQTEWEAGTGVYTAATQTLTRAVVAASSLAGATVNFSVQPIVALTMFSEDLEIKTEEAPVDGSLYARQDRTWQVVSGGGTSFDTFEYMYDGAHAEPPTSAEVRVDNSLPANVTKVWIHNLSSLGRNNSNYFSIVAVGARIFLQDKDEADRYISFNVINTPVNKGNYWEFPVELRAAGLDLLQQRILLNFAGGSAGSAAATFIGDNPPSNPVKGQLWYESDSGSTYIYYDDGNSAQWVQIDGGGGGAEGGLYLPLVGGVMTGPVTLAGNPATPLEAAPKQYIDAADAALTALIGQKIAKGGDVMTGFLTLSANPTANLHAATKQYVDAGDTAAATATGLKVDRAGDTMTGHLFINRDYPTLVLDTNVGNNHGSLSWRAAGKARWQWQPGADAASDLQLLRFDDAGAFVDIPLKILRASGYAVWTGNQTIQKANPALVFDAPGSGNVNGIYSRVAGVDRWIMQIGNGVAEGAGNAGSNFALNCYSNTGAYLSTPISITRANGTVTIPGTIATSSEFITSSGYISSSAVNAVFSAIGGGAIYLRPNGAASASNDVTIASSDGKITHQQDIQSKSANMVLGSNGGAIYMRPNGTGSNAGQALVDNLGNLSLTGKYISNQGYANRIGITGPINSNVFNLYYTGASAVNMYIDNTLMGVVAYTSDYRIKKDVADLPSTWEMVKLLRPVTYTHRDFSPQSHLDLMDKQRAEGQEVSDLPFVQGDDIERWGFVAHELQDTLVDSAASAPKDAPDALQAPNPWTVIAALTKALQEAMARIEVLEAKVP